LGNPVINILSEMPPGNGFYEIGVSLEQYSAMIGGAEK